jgi:hypothetical protein
MRVPLIIPASYPDSLDDAADGATFYVDPAHGKHYEGQAFIATSDLSAAKDARLIVRLADGRAFHFDREWRVRVIELGADTVDERW